MVLCTRSFPPLSVPNSRWCISSIDKIDEKTTAVSQPHFGAASAVAHLAILIPLLFPSRSGRCKQTSSQTTAVRAPLSQTVSQPRVRNRERPSMASPRDTVWSPPRLLSHTFFEDCGLRAESRGIVDCPRSLILIKSPFCVHFPEP